MALTYLVDTNIISELEKINANGHIVSKFQQHQDEVALSSISWHELLYGYHRLPKSKRKQRVRYFIENAVQPNIPVIPFNSTAARWFAEERARLSQIGRTPPFADGQIAATAATNNLILVTRNVDGFINFDGLTIENWFDNGK